MPAQPYSTGPSLIYVASPGLAAGFFGTGKDGGDLDIRPAYVPLMNDLAGPAIPYDEMQAGYDAVFSVTMTRWDHVIHNGMMTFAHPGIGTPGTEAGLDRGTLMLTEGQAFTMWILYPNRVKAAYAQLPAGYHFFACYLISPHKMRPGVRPYEVTFTFHAMPVFQPPSGNVPGGFICYNFDMNGLPAIN